MWYAVIGTVCSLLAYVTYQAKYDTHGWYGKLSDSVSRKHRKLRRASQIFNAFSNGIEAQHAPKFSINDTGCSASITYNHVGKSYMVNVPYKSKFSSAMIPLKATLIKFVAKDNTMKEIDITQEPGIPYIVCADDLGGKEIIIVNSFTGENNRYGPFQRPEYVEELHYSE